MMKMYFHFSASEMILFKGWVANNAGEMVASAIGVFLIAVLYEGLKALRDYMMENELKKRKFEHKIAFNNSSEHLADQSNSSLSILRLCNLSHVEQTILHMIQLTVSYFLMLIAMTYNAWLFIALILGLGAGYFIFGWRRNLSSVGDSNECCN